MRPRSFGCGIVVSVTSANSLATRSARQGYVAAQGFCALQGVTEPQNIRKGLKLLTEGAQAGVREAQFLVGFCFEYGRGTSVDLKEAVRWYRLAAV